MILKSKEEEAEYFSYMLYLINKFRRKCLKITVWGGCLVHLFGTRIRVSGMEYQLHFLCWLPASEALGDGGEGTKNQVSATHLKDYEFQASGVDLARHWLLAVF